MKLKKFAELNEDIRSKMIPKSEKEISSSLKKLHEEFAFKTTVTDYYIEYQNISDIKDVEYIEIIECKIYWNYDLSTASWGINYIMPRINKIYAEVEVFVYNEEKGLDDSIKRDFTYDIMNSDIDTTIEDDIQKLPFAPREINFSHVEIGEDNKPQIQIVF